MKIYLKGGMIIMVQFIIFMVCLYFGGKFIIDPLIGFFDISSETAWYVEAVLGGIIGLGAAMLTDKDMREKISKKFGENDNSEE